METLDIINDEDDLDILNQYVDLKYFAIEEAISYFIGSSDDLRNNNNNYLIYIRKSDRKMMIIPYDFDYCFGQGSSIWNPSSMAMSQNEMFSLHAYGSNQEISNSLFLKTILNENQVNIYQAYYLNTLKALKVSSFIQEATFNHLFEIYQNNYQNDSLFGFSLNNDENMSYQTYLNNKLKMIDLSLSLKNTSSQVKNNYVYLSLNQNQWNQVGIYTWNGLDLGSWPGKKMSYDETLGYYYYKMGKNVSCNVIFNNYQVGENSLQTEDLYYSSYNLFTLNYADNQENKLSGTWSKI
jgi:hypothetical protein